MTAKTYRLQKYTYTGTNAQGSSVTGEIIAANPLIAKALLRKQGIKTKKISKKSLSVPKNRARKIKSKDITFFTRQLATMLIAGIPLIQSFIIIAKGITNSNFQTLVNNICADIETGHTLVETLRKYPNYFNPLYCSLVAAGELSGSLDRVLERLATQKEKLESIKNQIRKALFYPATIILAALIVTAILLVFVVPQFEQLFNDFGAQLPFFTLMVIAISRFVQSYWWFLLGVVATVFWGILLVYKRSLSFRETMDRISLKLPWIGTLLIKSAIARFTRSLAITFSAGVPLVDGLQSLATAFGNSVFENAITFISTDIAKGQPLQHALRETRLFPEMVIQMVTVGEESGALDNMLSKVADFYEEEVDNTVASLANLLEPFIIAVLGTIIGALVIAMYLPIFKLGSVV